ncbi:MAG: resuscitation-promoting factor RpfE [Solirubrobacteraceae bacterium]|nr:resuscitation-promoting factor RpfE [Solirubrobacteraceae bacterium]
MRLRTLGAVCASCAASAPTSLVLTDPAVASPVPVAPPLAGSAAAGPPPPVGSVAALTTPFVAPASAYAAVKARLVERNVFLKQRHLRLFGERLTRSERSHRREILQLLSAERVAAKNVRLRHDIRELRERLTSAAPDVPIPAQLAAIARCESGGDPRAVSASGMYRGKYQFSMATWRTVGGRGDPAEASETEQDRRAAMLYRRHGAGQWPVCGR